MLGEPRADWVGDGSVADWRGFNEGVYSVQVELFDDASARITAVFGLKRCAHIYGQPGKERIEAIQSTGEHRARVS